MEHPCLNWKTPEVAPPEGLHQPFDREYGTVLERSDERARRARRDRVGMSEAAHSKRGDKTDLGDAKKLGHLHRHGLLRGSFLASRDLVGLRDRIPSP